MKSEIQFILNHSPVKISNQNPTETLLEYIRSRRLCGTKEGCAEGDCGACTVVVATLCPDTDTVKYDAVNSCVLFLPMLHGKQVLTVEYPKTVHGTLHPVQRCMVENHASQCGFCTPGFVMSLFALYRNRLTRLEIPDSAVIEDTLIGNLCRCTGYRPILDAARSLCKDRPFTDSADDADVKNRLKQLSHKVDSVLTHDAGRTFFIPKSLWELTDYYEKNPTALLLGGGTDIGLWVTKQHKKLNDLIYTGRVPELNAVRYDAGTLIVGGAVTYSALLPFLRKTIPALEALFLRIGSKQIRNSGTVAGNIANSSPIGDTPPALMVLDAELELMKNGVGRSVNINQFFTGYRQNVLRPGELITAIMIPKPSDDVFFRTYKLSKRFDQDISAVCGAYAFTFKNGIVESAKIAYGGMAPTPKRAHRTELKVIGMTPENLAKQAFGEFIDQDYTPIDDMRASAKYRSTVAKNMLVRFFAEYGQGESYELCSTSVNPMPHLPPLLQS